MGAGLTPEPSPIDFVLTPAERDVARLAAVEIEAHRRRQNERDAKQKRNPQ